jgi:uncharacterized protein (DUF2252 family)
VAELFSDAGSAEIDATVHDAIRSYRRSLPGDRRHLLETYQYVEVARKVVGVGSVGTRAWVVLFMGRDDADPLFLQVKEAQASVLESFVGKSQYANHGQRVVEGQKLVQAAGDIFLGFQHVTGHDGVVRDYYMRQLWDWKMSADIETMRPDAMKIYAQICGWTLARAHARSGDRIAIAAYLGNSETFDAAIADFGAAYAEQNDLDHRALISAIEQGRLQAEFGI